MRTWICTIFLLAGVLTFCWTAAPRAGGADLNAGEKIGPINVTGNQKIKTYIIRREIRLRTGDLYDPGLVEEAKKRIRRIPGVDYSDIFVYRNASDSTLGLTLFVTEKSALDGYPVVLRGRENRMSFGMRAAARNFRGRSETLSGSILFRGNNVFSAGWENPWLGDNPHRIGMGVRVFFKDYEYVYRDAGGVFLGADIRRYGAEFSVFRIWAGESRVSVNIGFEQVESGVEGVTLRSGGDGYVTASLGFCRDHRDSRRFPWTGTIFSATLREIGPGDDTFSIHEGKMETSLYLPLASRTVLAFGGRLNYRDGGQIPIYRREHLGGSSTLRGREFGSFHGIRSLISGVEYRLPINFSRARPVEDILMGISAHLFADAGAAWEDGQDLNSDIFHGTFGLGILLLNGSVPGLRIDYGWHQNSSGRWEVDIGAKF